MAMNLRSKNTKSLSGTSDVTGGESNVSNPNRGGTSISQMAYPDCQTYICRKTGQKNGN